jgi:hypothetical protein
VSINQPWGPSLVSCRTGRAASNLFSLRRHSTIFSSVTVGAGEILDGA